MLGATHVVSRSLTGSGGGFGSGPGRAGAEGQWRLLEWGWSRVPDLRFARGPETREDSVSHVDALMADAGSHTAVRFCRRPAGNYRCRTSRKGRAAPRLRPLW